MKLESIHVIDGKPVIQRGTLGPLKVYRRTGDDLDEAHIYFVTATGAVCGTLDVFTDCNQNCGFIDSLVFTNLEKPTKRKR